MRMPLLALIVFSISCNTQSDANFKSKIIKADSINNIDYKLNIYKLFIGQTKDSLSKTIEIRRNFEVETNKKSNSIEHYMNIGEDLINIVDIDTIKVLPALYMSFNKGILTNFECFIIYQPSEKSKQAIDNFLNSLKPIFKRLNNNAYKKTLAQNLSICFENSKSEEKYYVDTSKDYELLFVYQIKTKQVSKK